MQLFCLLGWSMCLITPYLTVQQRRGNVQRFQPRFLLWITAWWLTQVGLRAGADLPCCHSCGWRQPGCQSKYLPHPHSLDRLFEPKHEFWMFVSSWVFVNTLRHSTLISCDDVFFLHFEPQFYKLKHPRLIHWPGIHKWSEQRSSQTKQ